MNREDLLFNNNFIKKLDIEDIPSNQKELFIRNHEKKKQTIHKQEILKRSKIMNNNNNINNNEIYEELATFYPKNEIPLNLIKQKNIKIERDTIVSIDSKYRDVDKYPKQNDFTSFLGKTFFNVKKIELVSTEFPNTDQVIKDTPLELQNNLISWENEEDYDLNYITDITLNTIVSDTVDITLVGHGFTIGSSLDISIYNSKLNSDISITGFIDGKKRVEVIDADNFRFPYINGISEQGTANIDLGFPKYSVNIKPGNYTATTLAEQMTLDLGNVKRRNGNGQYHYFEVTVNLDTDVMILDSVITTQLPNNSLSTTAGSTTITVNQQGHGFKTGERVKMIGVKNVAGIPGTLLSGDFIVTVLDFNTFTYEVTTRANETTEGGGNTVQTGKNAPFRLLFDTENTLFQFNTGFPDEDSSEYIGSVNSITTKALSISNAEIIGGDKVRLTTTIDHELDVSTVIQISDIAIGSPPVITTALPHGLQLPGRLTVRNTNSFPTVDGTFFAIPTGINTFKLQGLTVVTSGNTGQILYDGDKVDISGLKSVPNIEAIPSFFIENVPSLNQFDITFPATQIDNNSISSTIVKTSQIFINHPNHLFNRLTSITPLNSLYANIKTYIPHSFIGTRVDNVSIIDGPVGTNTVDILLTDHDLVTSDEIIIQNSTSVPVVDGTFKVQVIDTSTLRINFVHSTFVDGDGTILTGDKISISNSNSLPRIDGIYSIHNKEIISNISTGTITSTITTTTDHNWSVGDIVFISESNSTPDIDGEHTIQSIITSNSFTVDISSTVTSPGTLGTVVNKNRMEIYTGFEIVSPGTNPAGILGRNQDVLHYRIEPEAEGTSDIGGIPLKVLNGISKPIARIIDVDNYMVRTEEEFASKTVTAGGSNIRVSSMINGFRSIQANTFTGDSTGILFRSISLEGENYVYLVSPGLNTVLNSSNISDAFAKILLSESPGTLMFNTFISAPKIFDTPISKIDTMRFQIKNSNGFSFNFNDINYSLSLKITELVDQLNSANNSSRTGTTEYENRISFNNSSIFQSQETDSGKSGTSVEAIGPGQSVRAGRAGSSIVGGR